MFLAGKKGENQMWLTAGKWYFGVGRESGTTRGDCGRSERVGLLLMTLVSLRGGGGCGCLVKSVQEGERMLKLPKR